MAPVMIAVGSYTSANEATGLGTYWWDEVTQRLSPAGTAVLRSPTMAAWHPRLPLLYAVNSEGPTIVSTLAVGDDGAVVVLAQRPTGGANPCWVALSNDAGLLMIANYDSGSAAFVPLGEDGLPTGDPVVVQHHGSGPVPDRQQGPHVHQVVQTSDGEMLASDLGTDEIACYRRAEGAPVLVGSVRMPAGSGPRHIALTDDGVTAYVAGELDGTVTKLRHGPAGWSVDAHVPATSLTGSQPSHIQLTADGRWLVIANRTVNTIAVLDPRADLAIVSEAPCGEHPRHFALIGDRVLVACQFAGRIDVLRLDPATGALQELGQVATPGEQTDPFVAPSALVPRP